MIGPGGSYQHTILKMIRLLNNTIIQDTIIRFESKFTTVVCSALHFVYLMSAPFIDYMPTQVEFSLERNDDPINEFSTPVEFVRTGS